MLSSPSEGRPLAAVIINDCWIPWFINSELGATSSHSDLIGGFPLKHSQISTLRPELSPAFQHSQISTLRPELSPAFQHSQISTLRSVFSDQQDQHSQIIELSTIQLNCQIYRAGSLTETFPGDSPEIPCEFVADLADFFSGL